MLHITTIDVEKLWSIGDKPQIQKFDFIKSERRGGKFMVFSNLHLS